MAGRGGPPAAAGDMDAGGGLVHFHRALTAALIAAAVLLPAAAGAAERFLDLKTGEAAFEVVLKDAASGGFEVWMAGNADNPDRPVVLARKGGWRFDATGTALKPATPTAAELERVLRLVNDTFWNPGAATALGADGQVAAYVLPKGAAGAYRFPADNADKTFRLVIDIPDTGGAGGGGGGGGGGAGGGGGGGSGGSGGSGP